MRPLNPPLLKGEGVLMQLLDLIFWSSPENFYADALGLGAEPPPPKQSCKTYFLQIKFVICVTK